MCGDRQHALVSKVYGNVIRFKEAARGVDDRLENWLQLIRRATDDVEHVAGRGLILKIFLQFSNQPRVLNRNDRLFVKGFDEVDLLACKGPHHGALQSDDADGAPSRMSGIPSIVRLRPRVLATSIVYSRSACMSWMWTTCFSSSVRPTSVPRVGSIASCCKYASCWGSRVPVLATSRNELPSRCQIVARSASHSCAADLTKVSKIDFRSNAERLMTLSTSEVAVCCSSASPISAVRACTCSKRRTFSIAITAWSAKLVKAARFAYPRTAGVRCDRS